MKNAPVVAHAAAASRRRRFARLVVAASAALLVAAATEHQAGAQEVLTEIALATFVVDLAAVSYDTVVVASNGRPLLGLAVAEAVAAVPQLLVYGWLAEEMTRSKEDFSSLGVLAGFGAVPAFMMTAFPRVKVTTRSRARTMPKAGTSTPCTREKRSPRWSTTHDEVRKVRSCSGTR